MKELLIAVVVLATIAFGLHATARAPQAQVSHGAKAAFILKCFRNRTKQACEAPPEARLPK